MTYQIEALPLAPFAPLFALSDEDLAAVGARRWTADAPGRACRTPTPTSGWCWSTMPT